MPFAVLPAGSSRHLPLPPTCLIWPALPLSDAALTVQVNDADPAPPRPSAAVTATLYVPGREGQPVITPAEVIERPAGRPAALNVGAKPAFWSGPDVRHLEPDRGACRRRTVRGGHGDRPVHPDGGRTPRRGPPSPGSVAVLVGVTVTECIPTGVDDDQLSRPLALSERYDGSAPVGA